ncbi:uncharacterized protein LOC125863875 [Solanum stenotomum]|uniref:uncharacterized protein LOC125863875 n=1 Tax=Solanum stenotomum TaxID=172797 RepID=UPI0020D0A193|nr:uncharacterized protein LOC125863875 [Solanum stenotomum]
MMSYQRTISTKGGMKIEKAMLDTIAGGSYERDNDEIEVIRESKNATENETKVTQRVVHMPKPPTPFPQRFVKKTEEGKYQTFITMFKQLSINVLLIETLKKMLGSMKQESDLKSVSVVNHIVEGGCEVSIEERLGVDALAGVIMNFKGDGIEDYDELVAALYRFEFRSKPNKLELDMKNRDSPPAKPYVEKAPKLELKDLPSHLRYVFLGRDETLSVIIVANLCEVQVEALVYVLKRFKRAIRWTIADIIGIPLVICTHKIQLMLDSKPSIEHQRRLNPPMQEVVKMEIIKWLDAGVIYPIADCNWVCHVQCVPKKGGISVVPNVKNDLVMMRLVTSWRVCLEYRRMNAWT